MHFFLVFKKYIEKSEVKMNKIENKEEKEKYVQYITRLFESFCPIFFSEIKSIPSNYDIWESSFPKEWKISSKNKEKIIPPVILREFLRWSQNRIFKNDEKTNNDECLTEVIRGIFPNIHASLFTSFLVLFHSVKTEDVLDKEPNFYLTGTIVSNIGFAGEVEEVKSEGINNDTQKQEISQKEETIQIILNFFPHFVNKLEKLKKEIESIKIDENCNDSKRKKVRKTELLKLVELLLSEMKKHYAS